MPLLLLFLWPVLEIYVLVQVGGRFGVVNAIFALVVAGVVGIGLAKSQGRYVLGRMQEAVGRGQMPTSQVIQSLMIFMGGILFLVPGFVSDVVGFFFVVPGPRHVIAALVTRQLERKLASGQFRVFSSGPFQGGVFRGGGFGGSTRAEWKGFGQTGGGAPQEPQRDVTPKVIDVTPISSRTQRDQNSNSDGQFDH